MLGGIGAIAIPAAIPFSFFTSDDDYDDTAAGLVSLATLAAIGIFAWTTWLIAAGCYVLFTRERAAPVTGAREDA